MKCCLPRQPILLDLLPTGVLALPARLRSPTARAGVSSTQSSCQSKKSPSSLRPCCIARPVIQYGARAAGSLTLAHSASRLVPSVPLTKKTCCKARGGPLSLSCAFARNLVRKRRVSCLEVGCLRDEGSLAITFELDRFFLSRKRRRHTGQKISLNRLPQDVTLKEVVFTAWATGSARAKIQIF
jgi:hypothetical protein